MRESLADRYEQLAKEFGWSPDDAPGLLRTSMKTLTDLRRVLTEGGLCTDPKGLEKFLADRAVERDELTDMKAILEDFEVPVDLRELPEFLENRERTLEELQEVLEEHGLPGNARYLDFMLKKGAVIEGQHITRVLGHTIEDFHDMLDALQTYDLPMKGLKEALNMRLAFAPMLDLKDSLKQEENRRELAELEAERVGELYYKVDDEVAKLKSELLATQRAKSRYMGKYLAAERLHRQALNLVLDAKPEAADIFRMNGANMRRRFREQRKQLRDLNRAYKVVSDQLALKGKDVRMAYTLLTDGSVMISEPDKADG